MISYMWWKSSIRGIRAMCQSCTLMCGQPSIPAETLRLAFSDTALFVAYAKGRCVGRVAGIINHRANKPLKIYSLSIRNAG